MDIIQFESHGRKLMVEFKCYRCKKTTLRPFEECVKEVTDGVRGLYDLRPPQAWKDGGFYYPMFCPDCKKAYEDFMKGGN
jgi:hypothetical protein